MLYGLLNFGEGNLALNYLIFCIVGSLGALQFAAARARLVGLMVFPPRVSAWLGAALVVGAYAWFFTIQPDLFIPGLAGGELSTLAAIGFIIALLLTLSIGIIANRFLATTGFRKPYRRERIVLGKNRRAELWLPRAPLSPLVLAFRESNMDSLDVLSGELVARGAAVLLCDHTVGQLAYEFAVENAPRFNLSRLYAIGVGYGGDRALALQTRDEFKLRAVLALAPFGSEENARPGLRWLRETDYLTALSMTLRGKEIPARVEHANALVVYGDDDTLVPPATARRLFPEAVLVAGARHLNLAQMAATLTLVGDWLELRPSLAPSSERVTRRRVLPGEITD